VAPDTHERHSFGGVEDAEGRVLAERTIPHRRGEIRDLSAGREPGTPAAVKTIGSWYWIVDDPLESRQPGEMREAGVRDLRATDVETREPRQSSDTSDVGVGGSAAKVDTGSPVEESPVRLP
jgi:hypothetical protein